jgi:hypothetical protein
MSTNVFKIVDGVQIELTEAEYAQHIIESNRINNDPVSKAATARFNRSQEYPPIADYIDGVVKGDQAQIQKYIDACLAVKAKYPKP